MRTRRARAGGSPVATQSIAAQLRAILESTADGILVVDDEGKVAHSNGRFAELWRIPPDVLESRDDQKLLDYVLDQLTAPEAFLSKVQQLYASREEELDVLHFKDGRIFERFSSPLMYGDRVKGRVWSFRDVTERNRAEKEKQRLEAQIRHTQKLESLGVLAGGIAHDFNNLLVAIMGNTDLALMSLGENEPARACMEDVVKASQRAADLCRQLLAYSGKGRFMVQPVDLSEVVKEMGDLLAVSVAKRAELRYDLADDLPAVEVDLTQLRQVVMNLITNSADAIDDTGGSIRVTTRVEHYDASALAQTYLDDELEPGRYAWVEVADDGKGMDADILSRIFDPFFSSKKSGHGLGLAATLGIVRGHKGAIQVESEPGKGSRFRVLFPTSDRAAVALVAEGETRDGWSAAGTVLVIDDESSVLRFTRKLLERAGFDVLTATGGREGVTLFRENSQRVSVVLLDMTMPQMDGETTLVELRRIRDDVRVVLSSGFTEQSVTERFAGMGLAGFVQKPYRARTLLETLRDVLA